MSFHPPLSQRVPGEVPLIAVLAVVVLFVLGLWYENTHTEQPSAVLVQTDQPNR